MSGIGYKAFQVSSKDVTEFGTIQDKLTTIEFGFSPFIPFSRLYEMVISEQIAEGFDRGAAGVIVTGNKRTKTKFYCS